MNKKMFALVGAFVLLLGTIGTLWALDDVYNRPNPLIDYVAQEIGIYDTEYYNLGVDDCRACHGDSLADRHHYTDIVLRDHLCTPCHEVIPTPPGVIVIRDCTTSGCHSWDDVLANGWHHDTDMAAAENCVDCHDTNIVNEITSFTSFAQYPPSVVTPTPFSCENCHWDQELVANTIGYVPGNTTKPTAVQAGHPSSFDHFDAWGNFVGYYEYEKPITGNFDTHHMGFEGSVASQCFKCHANDPRLPNWDPYDPELIRYCEVCHDISTLHTIFPHVGPPGTGDLGAYEGWEAVGFHAGGAGSVPTVYQGNGVNVPPIGLNSFSQNEMCFGCHGDAVPPYEGEIATAPNPLRYLDSQENPIVGGVSVCPTGYVTIAGTSFGIEDTPERGVQLKEGLTWVDVPVYSWTDTRIVIEIPAWTFTPGNKTVRVYNEGGKNSTLPKITIMDCASPADIIPDRGACNTEYVLTNTAGTFGGGRDTNTTTTGTGLFKTIVMVSSGQTYVAGYDPITPDYITKKWSNTAIKVKIDKAMWFVDTNGNFLRETGEVQPLSCDGFAVGTYSVYIKYVFYTDSNANGRYDSGEPMNQVESSNPVTFELTNAPWVTGVNPAKFEIAGDRVVVLGVNYGPTQFAGDGVYIGSKAQYLGASTTGLCYGSSCFNGTPSGGKLQNSVKMWSNTKVKVKAKVNAGWAGKTKYVWVVKEGKVSNAKKIGILP